MQPRVFEFAKKIGLKPLELMDKIRAWGLPVKSHMSVLEPEVLEKIQKKLSPQAPAKRSVTKKAAKTTKKTAKKSTKKTTAKAAATKPKKVVTKKAPTKKAVKKVVKKVAPKVAAVIAAQAEPKPAPARAKVVRRKGAYSPEKLKEKALEAEAQKTTPIPAPKAKEGTSPKILGHVDLSQLQKRPSQAQPKSAAPVAGTADTKAPPKPTTRGRFVESSQHGGGVRDRDDKTKSRGAGGREAVVVPAFNAADFRKREVVFQPKKKRVADALVRSKKTQLTKASEHKRVVHMHGVMSVANLAHAMGVKAAVLMKKLIQEGIKATLNTDLDADTVELLAMEHGFKVENKKRTLDDSIQAARFGDVEHAPQSRPPVVTVMGHVDHGKTTLLDAIRKAETVSGEAGGITQHIGAYKVQCSPKQSVTFIDTPGHEAFTNMRLRGANVTDVVILVVAADDGVMPQTKEAIDHAKAAGVPLVVAVNKIDKLEDGGGDLSALQGQLSQLEVVSESWGGDVPFCKVSALKQEGLDTLLEQVLLVAEMKELKANPKCSALGVVLESHMDPGLGPVSTVLIQEGKLKKMDHFVAGDVVGRVRRLQNYKGEDIKQASPSDPVRIVGFCAVGTAGDRFVCVKSEQAATDLAKVYQEEQEAKKAKPVSEAGEGELSLEELFAKVKTESKVLSVVLKADVSGSLEALAQMCQRLSCKDVELKLVGSGVGGVSKNDVLLAATSGAVILGFSVGVAGEALKLAKERGVLIQRHRVIYEMEDYLKQAMEGLLDPKQTEESEGRVEVRKIFKIPRVGTIAGCAVVDGKICKSSSLRLMRDGKQVYEGVVSSLKREKDDAKEVAVGFECGVSIANFNDIKVGDVIESFRLKEVPQKINWSN